MITNNGGNITNNGGGYDKIRNVTGFWDLSKYGLRPPPTIFIDNYNYPLSPNPLRKTDNVPQVTLKTTSDFDKKEAYLGSLYSLGMTQDVVPSLVKKPNALKAYFIPSIAPEIVPEGIPIHDKHFVFNRDTADKLLSIGIDTCPATVNYLKKNVL